MWIFLIGCGVIEIGGLLALLLSKHTKTASAVAVVFSIIGCAVTAIPTIQTFMGIAVEPLNIDWNLPIGAFQIAMDPLSAFFMLPILILAPLTGIYGMGYLKGKPGIGSHFFFFNTLVASMMLLVAATNAVLFLIVWEVMAISSFFLVTFDDHLSTVREAGWTYLIATHIGVMALLAFFGIMGHQSGDFSFDKFVTEGQLSPTLATVVFLFAIIGFGSKAGIFPLHIWLPDAHPAAPSHVSALMSGAMIKMGIYGLVRTITFLHPFTTETWGWTLVTLGILAALVGIVSALAQHNLKRMLAYSSVENIGIICIGIGSGMLGMVWENTAVSVLGFGGALLHVLNHSVFKGLLFLGAGTVVHETGTKEMNHLGGLIKKMPFTAFFFIVGAAAAAALPPFNGFISEFLIYLSGVKTALSQNPSSIILAAIILTSLPLVGGLAIATYTKCAGLIFLGEPRTSLSKEPKDPGLAMKLPTLILGIVAFAMGIAAPATLSIVAPSVKTITAVPETLLLAEQNAIVPSLFGITFVALGAMGIFAIIFVGLQIQSKRKGHTEDQQPTWDCGYAKPASSMQYTPSSFSAPLTELFSSILRLRTIVQKPEGYFPSNGTFKTVISDRIKDTFFAPLFQLTAKILLPLKILQHGHVHIYVVYVAATLIALLFIAAGN